MSEAEMQPGIASEEKARSRYQDTLKKMREAVSRWNPELSKQIEETGDVVKYVLYNCLTQENSNPEIAGLFQEVANNLHTTVLAGAELVEVDKQKNTGKLVVTQRGNDDAKAALLGASMVLDYSADRRAMSEQQPIGNLRYLHRFLEMVQRRVGKLDTASGTSELRVSLDSKQATPTVKYTPPKP